MDSNTIRIVAGVLAVIIVGIIIWRRKQKAVK
jgi:LPXTG-motif cell wall-anchored protein